MPVPEVFRRDFPYLFPCVLFLGLLAASASAAESPSPTSQARLCHPSKEVDSVLRTYRRRIADRPFPERADFLERQLLKHPGDVFLHRIYQDLMLHEKHGDTRGIVERYAGLMKRHPEQPAFLYLYARTLIDDRPEEAERLLEKALRIDPDYPWAHLALAYLARMRTPPELDRAADHLMRVVAVCPDFVDAYRALDFITDRERSKVIAEHLRHLLESSLNESNYSLYDDLWSREFQLTPPDRHDRVRARIREDLRRIRRLHLESDYTWWDLLRDGYLMIGDAENAEDVADEIIRRFPRRGSYLAFERLNRRFPPPETDDPEELREYSRKLLRAVDDAIGKYDENPLLWMLRLDALEYQEHVDPDELRRTSRRFLETYRRADVHMSPPPEFRVADVYLKFNVDVAEVPPMIERALAEMEREHRREIEREGIDEKERRKRLVGRQGLRFRGYDLEIQAYRKLEKTAEIDRMLERLDALVQAMKLPPDATAVERKSHRTLLTRYWSIRAETAAEAGRFLDALAYYRNVFTLEQEEGRFSPDLPHVQKAREIWKRLGGSELAWKAWLQPGPASLDESHARADMGDWNLWNQPLPPVDLFDLTGRRWTSRDFQGKTVFINFWGRFCGPCLAELPLIQELYDKLKGRRDVLLVTFNVDRQVGFIEPYLKEKQYTFPVLLASSYFDHHAIDKGVPQNWIVDPSGVIRRQQVGFGGEVAHWVDRILRLLDEVQASPKSPANAPPPSPDDPEERSR